MHKSAITAAILDRLRRDLIHNPLMLLSGIDVLGITSSTLATLSGTVAQLSSDGKFLQLRSKQASLNYNFTVYLYFYRGLFMCSKYYRIGQGALLVLGMVLYKELKQLHRALHLVYQEC